MLNAKTVFVLTPHPDDLEIGCGGTVARLIEEGAKVCSIVFCKPGDRDKEMIAAGRVFGIQKYFNLNLTIRNLEKNRQGILDLLLRLRNKHNPDLVIQPSLSDIHQDHQTVANEGLRAFKGTTILGYEALWNNMNFESQMFVKLDKRHIEKKIKAAACYRTQADKPYMDEGFFWSLATVRGVQVGVDFAEVFNVVRMVV